MDGPDLTLDEARQRANLAFIASGAEFAFGNAAALPLPVAALKALHAGSPGVEAVHDGGLTAEVLCLHHAGRRWAVKRARTECLVRNPDGETSFLNELQRHAELAPLKLPGVASPVYGSLRNGLVVSPWIAGRHPGVLNERQARTLLESGCALIEQGFFEWDYSAGNLLDDGERLWLYDFGYCYRFDPLTQLNSAGHGLDHPQHHPAERIEGRHLFGALLDAGDDDDDALSHFIAFKQLAAQAYEALADRLAGRGATSCVLGHYRGLAAHWRQELADAPGGLYLAAAWQAHSSDLDDDLRGRSCTPRTLRRALWLQRALREHAAELRACGALSPADAALSDAALLQRLCQRELEARQHQL
ncbi:MULTISPECIES: hypothetical protein [unclassified Roseateles]|uniref:hypothetical protein n=1 Tax=unclassified Roseateles TaxID=2626991 RepID=UPI0007000E00|nr:MULTISPECIES: hypothetical protein [unclassified Roseateles]KQW43396.1 hypothetical protein ASC81_16595 [Pelomonas sp. Root405]KRA71134.1 hypothetical protein ASD88_15115 [Pelomonas sp. Root662]